MVSRPKLAYTGKLNVRDYSDVELRTVKLSTDDPESLGKISSGPPRDDEDLEFVSQYTASETLICAFGHRHKRGFLLKDGEGSHHLIGKDCAAEHYGLEWDHFVKSVATQMDRQRSLSWLHEISGRVLDARPKLEAVVSSPSVTAFDNLRVRVKEMPTVIYEAFFYSAKELDTWMRSTFLERDLGEERRRKEKCYEAWQGSLKDQEASADERQRLKSAFRQAEKAVIMKPCRKPILRCPAASLFVGIKMSARLEAIRRDLMAQAENLQSAQRYHPDQVAKSLAETTKKFDAILTEVDSAAALFSPRTLDALELLFSGEEYKAIKVERVAGGLSFQPAEAERFLLQRPDDLQPLDFSLYDLIRP